MLRLVSTIVVLVLWSTLLSASASTLNGGRNGQRAAPPVLELNSSRQAIRLGGYWAMLQDPSAALTFKEILSLPRAGAFVPLAANSLSLGYTESAVWLHFRVRNAAPAVIDWLLEVDYPLLDRIDVYSRHEHHDGWHLTTIGDRLPFSQRPLPHRSFLLPLLLPYRVAVQMVSAMGLVNGWFQSCKAERVYRPDVQRRDVYCREEIDSP